MLLQGGGKVTGFRVLENSEIAAYEELSSASSADSQE